MSLLEDEGESFGGMRDDDQVDVIGHEAIAGNGKPMQSGVVTQQVEIDEAVGIAIENELPAITALRDVVGHIDGDYASKAGHRKER